MYAGMGLMPEWYDENVSIAALMGPCTSPSTKYFDMFYKKHVWDWLVENEIWVMDGPYWETRDKPLILAEGPAELIDNMSLYDGLPNNPITAIAAYGQAAYTNRF